MIKRHISSVREAEIKLEHLIEVVDIFHGHVVGMVNARARFDPAGFLQLPLLVLDRGKDYCQREHELAYAAAFGQIGVFKSLALPLQMAEERLDVQFYATDFERFRIFETMPVRWTLRILAVADPLGVEVKQWSEDQVELVRRTLTPESGTAEHHERDHHQLEPRGPAAVNKRRFHRQYPDVRGGRDTKHLQHHPAAGATARIFPLSPLGQDSTVEGQFHSVENYADLQYVNMGSADLPVRIYGRHPAAGGLRGDDHQDSDPPGWKRTGGEDALEAPLDRLDLGGGLWVAGELDERFDALSHSGRNHRQRAGGQGFGQTLVSIEIPAEDFRSSLCRSRTVAQPTHYTMN